MWKPLKPPPAEKEPEIYRPKPGDWVMTRAGEAPFSMAGDIGLVVEGNPAEERSFRVKIDFNRGARVFLGADGVYFEGDASVKPRRVHGGGVWWAGAGTEQVHVRRGLVRIPAVLKARAVKQEKEETNEL